jgi:hypothetical protein
MNVGTGSVSTSTGSINTASTSYIVFNCQTASGTDVCLLVGYSVVLIP